jgi:DNA polymerase
VFKTHGKIYEASAEQMFSLPAGSVTKKSPYRQKGKISELALGYQGGAGALKTMGALEMGLTEDELEPIKDAWRAANPEIVQFWYACENAAKKAILQKTSVVLPIAGKRTNLVFAYEGGFLTIQLPSKRKLFYVKPRIEAEDLVRETSYGGTYVVARAGSLTYEGQDQKTKQWTRLATYGGKLVENITQAVARDCLRESMLALDEAGYTQLATVHDEIIMEMQGGTLKEAEEIMGQPIPWAPGLPLRGDGFETQYYMKETD